MDEKKTNLAEIARKKRYISLVEKMGRGAALSPKEIKELDGFEKSEAKKLDIVINDGTVDLQTISLYLDKSTRMVRRYIRQGMPVVRDDSGEIFRFKVGEVFKWYYSGKGVDEDGGKEYWENEYKKSRAQINKLLLKEKEGELISFEDHVSIVKNQIRGIKTGFLRLPKHVAPKLYQQDPKVICDILDEEIRFIINQFAEALNANKSGKRNT